jgi:hypothetical protein
MTTAKKADPEYEEYAPGQDDDEIPVDKALDFTSPETVPHVKTPFKIDGELMWAVRPKGGQMMAIARDYQAAAGDELAELRMIEEFLDLCLEPEAADRIRERLSDAEDPFDVDTLVPLIEALQTAWSGRQHTGRPSSSSPRRRRTGRTSTARRR